MGCSNGCGTGTKGLPAGCNNNGACGTSDGCNKLTVFDWLGNMSLPQGQKPCDIVEVRFKNSRKEYFRNVNNLSLSVGDAIAVEAQSGHDMGMVSLTGELVRLQLKKKNINFDSEEIKKVYRKAKQTDIDKWREAQALETSTMYRARTIALRLGLEMKLSDVEYQGDKSKSIFYYTADARVDFRELIKVLADEFKVRIEMRQIGARQEASRLGGIGSCGRELCCSTWLTDFRTVNTSAARYQQLSLNPLKLAGQCGKLKCCLNYELDSYIDALKDFPDMEGKKLQTKKADAFLQKTDIFAKTMWFSYRGEPGVLIPLSVEAVKEIVAANARGEMPEELTPAVKVAQKVLVAEPTFENLVGQDSLTRFDSKKGGKGRQQNRGRNRGPAAIPPKGKPASGGTLKSSNESLGTKPQPNRNNKKNNPNRQQEKGQGQNQGNKGQQKRNAQGNRPNQTNPEKRRPDNERGRNRDQKKPDNRNNDNKENNA